MIEAIIIIATSTTISLFSTFFIMKRILRKYEPLVKRAFTIISTQGVEAREQIKFTEEQKELIKEIDERVVEGVLTQFPELSFIAKLLGEDIMEKLKTHPEMIAVLLQRYAPFIEIAKQKGLEFLQKVMSKEESEAIAGVKVKKENML